MGIKVSSLKVVERMGLKYALVEGVCPSTIESGMQGASYWSGHNHVTVVFGSKEVRAEVVILRTEGTLIFFATDKHYSRLTIADKRSVLKKFYPEITRKAWAIIGRRARINNEEDKFLLNIM